MNAVYTTHLYYKTQSFHRARAAALLAATSVATYLFINTKICHSRINETTNL